MPRNCSGLFEISMVYFVKENEEVLAYITSSADNTSAKNYTNLSIVGLPLASEIALTNRRITAQEALGFNLINKISQSRESVVDEAVEMAKKIAALSPDAVIITRAAVR